jgi:ribA/ribD-fused uncharacterized protein
MLQEVRGFFGPYRFLSNFHFVDVIYEGEKYRTTEHAYQASKFLDLDKRRYIQSLETPREARRVGQQPGMREDWDIVKIPNMYDFNCQKYVVPYLTELLLNTDDAYLEETNHWGDVFWGVCNGVGRNELGKLLMKIRADLREIHRR